MVDKRRLQHQVKMRWLKSDERAQESQRLSSKLLDNKDMVDSKEELLCHV